MAPVVLRHEKFKTMKSTIDQRKTALTTGLALVLMTIVAGVVMAMLFAELFTLDAHQLAVKLDGGNQFAIGILGWVLILVLDVMVSWGLYMYYKEQNRTKAAWMGLLRLMYSVILAIGIVKLFLANAELSQTNPNYEMVHTNIQQFQAIWQFGLIIFGIHLLLLAPLVCKKKSILQFISALLFVAGIGYVLSNTADLFIGDYELYRTKVEAVFVLPMVLGEFGLALWLVIRGGKESISQAKQFAF